jgi:hypothetical protein
MSVAKISSHNRQFRGRTPMTAITATYVRKRGSMTVEERLVIFASSLGTVFEWCDFYIYGTLAPVLAAQFFSCRRLRTSTLPASEREAGHSATGA